MKTILRIIFFLLAITCWVFAFLPPREDLAPSERTEEPKAPSPAATTAPAHSLVTDLLGGQQIRAGQKAREQLDKVKTRRDDDQLELE